MEIESVDMFHVNEWRMNIKAVACYTYDERRVSTETIYVLRRRHTKLIV